MVVITVSFPTVEEDERAKRFQVYKNYLQSLSMFLSHEYGAERTARLSGLLAAQKELVGFGRIQRKVPAEISVVRKYLILAWGSETQLRLGNWAEDDSSLPYSNAWAPIHAYYAVYASAQAWFRAQNQPPMHAHSGEFGHPVRLKSATWSGPNRPPVPAQFGHPEPQATHRRFSVLRV